MNNKRRDNSLTIKHTSCTTSVVNHGNRHQVSLPHLPKLQKAVSEAIKQPKNNRFGYCRGVVVATLFGLPMPAIGQVIELSDLDGNNGVIFNGEFSQDRSGYSVSNAGDINGDGFDDIVLGAPYGYNSIYNFDKRFAGAAFVIFGSDQGFNSPFELTSLDGANGFQLIGEKAGDRLGGSVSGAGDFNGDGVDDLVLGAWSADPNGEDSGASYVVFGSNKGFESELDLSNLNGVNGFRLNGAIEQNEFGRRVSGAGDINNDGFDDLAFGVLRADPNGEDSGACYVIFGSNSDFSSTIEISNLDGKNGFKLNGAAEGDFFCATVSKAGDVNGDNIDDLVVGAPGAESNGPASGAAYVVFGSHQDFDAVIELSRLNGQNGFTIKGEGDQVFGSMGTDVSGAGDFNGDGIDDLVLGASTADTRNGYFTGASYVIFGDIQGFDSVVNLDSLNSEDGIKFIGELPSHSSGRSVSGAGDVNDDGIDDIIIGAPYSSFNGFYSGASYVVFGNNGIPRTPVDLSKLDGGDGFRINGESKFDNSGRSVSDAGDINGDGVDDVLVGASFADTNGTNIAGKSYVIFGSSTIGQTSSPAKLAVLGDINGNGSEDIAVLVQDVKSGTVMATVKDAADDSVIQEIIFDGNLIPMALEVMDDLDGNGAPELALLSEGPAVVEIRDSLSGDLQNTIKFSKSISPIDLAIIPDQNGNGVPEVSVLNSTSTPYVSVITKDASDGQFLGRVGFSNRYETLELATPNDFDMNGGVNFAVLGIDGTFGGTDKVGIRDSDGTRLNNVFYQRQAQASRLTVMEDQNGNGADELVVLREGPTNVRINDAQTDAFVNQIGFNPNFAPQQVLAIPDLDANGSPEVGVVGIKATTDQVRVQIKDSRTDVTTGDVYFNAEFSHQDDIKVIDDMNGNGSSELAFLGKRKSDGKLKVFIKDSLTNELLKVVKL